MRHHHCRPCTELRPFIDRYWSWESADGLVPPLLPLMPGPGGMEVFFHLGEPFVCQATPCRPGGPLPSMHTVCIRREPAPLSVNPTSTYFIAVRIRAGALPMLTDIPIVSLTDHFVPAEEIWGNACRALFERLAIAPNLAERISLLDAFFLARLRPHSRCKEVGRAIQLLQTGQHRIADLAQDVGFGIRQFEIRFLNATGSSPVRFRRLARLRRSIRTLLLAPSSYSLTDLIDPAYFDQAQQTREFRELTGFSPKELRRQALSHAHFYNSPWNDGARLSTSVTTGELDGKAG